MTETRANTGMVRTAAGILLLIAGANGEAFELPGALWIGMLGAGLVLFAWGIWRHEAAKHR